MLALAQFPSQGDLLKFIYNATGIIPSKKYFIVDTEIDGKSLHKSLERLAKEEGDFLKHFEQHANEFRSAIHGLFANDMYSNTLHDPLVELFQIYTQTVLTDHTYLEKKRSLSYLIHNTFLQRATISIFKYQQYYSAFLDASFSPNDSFWYLGYKDITPLACVVKWIYDCEKKSQAEFHNTFCEKYGEDLDQIEKDLANVNNWASSTVKLPAFSNILDVFDRAFKFHNIEEDRRHKYIFFLLIARFATYCLKILHEKYEREDVSSILKKIKNYLVLLNKDYKQFCSIIEDNRCSKLTNAEKEIERDVGGGWLKIHNVDFFLDKCEKVQIDIAYNLNKIQSKYIEDSLKNNYAHGKTLYKIHQKVLERLNINSTAPDKFIIKCFQDTLVPFNDRGYIKNIGNCIYGYDVMKGKYNYQSWLKEYYKVGNDRVYPWLVHWIDGMRFFQKTEFEKALIEMQQAFKTIRYVAGSKQQRFIEDYMIVALAQANKSGNIQGWKDFKLAFKWGVFMNNFDAFPEFYSDKNDEELRTIFKENKKAFKSCSTSIMDTRLLAKLLFHWKYDT
ncbi:hypothetical protein ACWS81_10525 [Psychrobacter celer]